VFKQLRVRLLVIPLALFALSYNCAFAIRRQLHHFYLSGVTEYLQKGNTMKNLELLLKPSSYDCNLDCSYCFYKKTRAIYTGQKHRMSDEVLDKLCYEVMKYTDGGHCSFAWQGGEPTLCGLDFFKKVVNFQSKYGKSGQPVSNTIQTNGILLDKNWTDFFKQYSVFVGISLDGPSAVHNTYRRYPNGKGTFNKVMEKVRLLEKEKVEFNILSTIGKDTVKKAEEIYKFFTSKGLYYLQFIPAVDRKVGKMSGFSVDPEEYGDFLCTIFDLWWNNGNPYVSVRLFDNIMEILAGMEPSACSFKKRCGQYMVVEHNGDIYPCDFFVDKNWKMGNIFENSMEELVHKVGESFGKLKEITPEECKKCPWNFICNNGCLWFRNVKNGKPEDKDYLCPAYKKFFAHSMGRLREITEAIVKRQLAQK
jgi:uncharacterized protein